MKKKIDSSKWEWTAGEFFNEVAYLFGDLAGDWIVFGQDISWRNLSGHKLFHANNPEEFVREAVGVKDDYNFTLEQNKFGAYLMKVYHHDSPTGENREIYRQEDYVRDELNYYSRNELLIAFISYVRTYETSGVYWTARRECGKDDLRKLTKQDLLDIWAEFVLEEDIRADTIKKDFDYYLTKERRYRNGEIA